jgi:hypothetical protein
MILDLFYNTLFYLSTCNVTYIVCCAVGVISRLPLFYVRDVYITYLYHDFFYTRRFVKVLESHCEFIIHLAMLINSSSTNRGPNVAIVFAIIYNHKFGNAKVLLFPCWCSCLDHYKPRATKKGERRKDKMMTRMLDLT